MTIFMSRGPTQGKRDCRMVSRDNAAVTMQASEPQRLRMTMDSKSVHAELLSKQSDMRHPKQGFQGSRFAWKASRSASSSEKNWKGAFPTFLAILAFCSRLILDSRQSHGPHRLCKTVPLLQKGHPEVGKTRCCAARA